MTAGQQRSECNGTWPGPEPRRPFHVRDCPNQEATVPEPRDQHSPFPAYRIGWATNRCWWHPHRPWQAEADGHPLRFARRSFTARGAERLIEADVARLPRLGLHQARRAWWARTARPSLCRVLGHREQRSVGEAARRTLAWLGQDDTDFDHTEDRDARHCAREVLRLHEPDDALVDRVAWAVADRTGKCDGASWLGMSDDFREHFRDCARAALAALRGAP